jgi:hypothetical protein
MPSADKTWPGLPRSGESAPQPQDGFGAPRSFCGRLDAAGVELGGGSVAPEPGELGEDVPQRLGVIACGVPVCHRPSGVAENLTAGLGGLQGGLGALGDLAALLLGYRRWACWGEDYTSRDHGQLIDGIYLWMAAVLGGWAATAASGQKQYGMAKASPTRRVQPRDLTLT